MTEALDDEVREPERRLPRGVVVALIGLLALLPIAGAVAVFLALDKAESDPLFPPLQIGSCVDVRGAQHDVADVECPSGNGRVISVVASTADCPVEARWWVLRDSQIVCIQDVLP